MKTRVLISIVLLFLISCGTRDKKENTRNSKKTDTLKEIKKESKEKKIRELKNYKWIQDFKSNSDKFLGSLFIKPVNDSIFSSLRILKGKDTIYKIDHFDFWNSKGKDFDVKKDTANFYGYILRLLQNKHVVIGYYSNKGKYVADDLTLYWDKKEQIFKIMTPPY